MATFTGESVRAGYLTYRKAEDEALAMWRTFTGDPERELPQDGMIIVGHSDGETRVTLTVRHSVMGNA